MFERAAGLLDLNLAASLAIGDRAADLQAARAAGLGRGVLVATGYGSRPDERAAAAALRGDGFAVACRDTAGAAMDLLPPAAGQIVL
jgi:histidinol phosphatase-like enzyme